MIDVAATVLTWREQGRESAVARTVSVTGMSSRWPDEAVATSGDDVVGTLFGGAADEQLLPLLREVAGTGAAREVELVVGDADAVAAGLACGGRARVLLQPSADVPEQAWHALAAREPICLVTDLDGGFATAVVGVGALSGHAPTGVDDSVRRLFGQGASRTADLTLDDGRRALVTASWPPCRMVVVGQGQLATSLQEVCRLLGWHVRTVGDADADAATGAVRPLGRGDAVVVLSHDIDLSGRVLALALDRGVGYVGALGSRGTQGKRRDWLTSHGVDDDAASRIRGPAGLDVGARTPTEIAIAVVAEVLAARSGASAQPLRDRPGPVHVARV